jgi:hypothetical protein
MNIVLIGGIERREADLLRLAQRAGHQLECHTGHVGGRGAEGLKAMIERADAVIILTEINSHGSMYLAKRIARQLGRDAIVLRKCGPALFVALLEQFRRTGRVSSFRRCA